MIRRSGLVGLTLLVIACDPSSGLDAGTVDAAVTVLLPALDARVMGLPSDASQPATRATDARRDASVPGYDAVLHRGLFAVSAGQSNDVGLGWEGPDGRAPDPTVWLRQYVGVDSTKATGGESHDWGPLEPRNGSYFGCEFGFAAAAKSAGFQDIAIEKWSIYGVVLGNYGTPLAWIPSAHELYPVAIAHVKEAERTSPVQRPIDAMVWWQGETDAIRLSAAQEYGSHLAELEAQFRLDTASPDLVWVSMRLRADSARAYAAEERVSLQAWADGDPARRKLVNLDDLPTRADGTHYDAAALDEAGRRAFAALGAP